ncbi:keratin-associated protein 19-2-like [Venturia canescens]|uniref:keratin-associated protein 19-2-like n=1 Tax=Venturia canescens TaxID=32260 RepID=UPI001C9CADA6|nr:keratin-associated protein 19-2-like [Venturia canescens]
MRNYLLVTVITALIAVINGAVEGTEQLSKLTSTAAGKPVSDGKDLEGAASDRTFFIGREYGYGSGGYGGNYPVIGGNSLYGPTGNGYYNHGNGANSIYRGYQSGSGYGGILGGGHTGWGYYGNGGYGGSVGVGYGGYEDGYAGLGGRGYNRWNSLDGYGGYGGYVGTGYGGISGSGYGGYGASGYGASSYPYGYRGSTYGSSSGYPGYPSGYRGYS